MSRTEENKEVVDYMNHQINIRQNKRESSFEEIIIFRLDNLITMLADISKSLAIIADKKCDDNE